MADVLEEAWSVLQQMLGMPSKEEKYKKAYMKGPRSIPRMGTNEEWDMFIAKTKAQSLGLRTPQNIQEARQLNNEYVARQMAAYDPSGSMPMKYQEFDRQNPPEKVMRDFGIPVTPDPRLRRRVAR